MISYTIMKLGLKTHQELSGSLILLKLDQRHHILLALLLPLLINNELIHDVITRVRGPKVPIHLLTSALKCSSMVGMAVWKEKYKLMLRSLSATFTSTTYAGF